MVYDETEPPSLKVRKVDLTVTRVNLCFFKMIKGTRGKGVKGPWTFLRHVVLMTTKCRNRRIVNLYQHEKEYINTNDELI